MPCYPLIELGDEVDPLLRRVDAALEEMRRQFPGAGRIELANPAPSAVEGLHLRLRYRERRPRGALLIVVQR